MTNFAIAETLATNKIPHPSPVQSNSIFDFESVGSISNRVVGELMAKMQKNAS